MLLQEGRWLGMGMGLGLLLVCEGGCVVRSDPDPEPTSTHAEQARLTFVWRIVVDEGMGPWEASETERAIAEWTKAASCPTEADVIRARVDVGEAVPLGEVRVVMGDPTVFSGDPNAVGWARLPTGAAGSLVVLLPNRSDSDRSDFPRVVRHELGHAFGLGHDDGGPGVMMSAGTVARVTPRDAASYDARWCR